MPGGGVSGGGGMIGGRPSLAVAATGANTDSKNVTTMNMMPYLLVERMIPPFIPNYISNIYAISATLYFLKLYDLRRVSRRSYIRANIGGSKPGEVDTAIKTL